jgi:integrase
MAQVTKTASGKYKFVVTVNYKQSSKTFETKAAGYAWEEQLKAGKGNQTPNMTLADLLIKYRDEVTPSKTKSGERQETIRINKFLRDTELVNIKLSDLSTNHFDKWKNRRLKEVSNLSVLRELAILNPVFNHTKKVWKYITENPLDDLSKPNKPPSRDRLISQDEIDRLCHALGYAKDIELKSIMSRVGAGFLFAIETALRDKEICQLAWRDIKGNVLKVIDSKTASGIREVPLSKRALEIIEQCKGVDEHLVFGIKTSQRDALFRKAKTMAGITKADNLHFHDSRAEAITRLAQKLDILDLARMIGHKDLSMLMVYYRKKASDIVHQLD